MHARKTAMTRPSLQQALLGLAILLATSATGPIFAAPAATEADAPTSRVEISTTAPRGPEGRVRGLLFVGRWEFPQGIEFRMDGKAVRATHGTYAGVVVDADPFVARDAPQPLIFAEGTAAVTRGGPFETAAGDTYMLVQLPIEDLAGVRFWIGPRVLQKDVSEALVADARVKAEGRKALSRAIGRDDLARATRQLAAASPARDFDELHGAVDRFQERDAARGAERIDLDAEPR